VFQKVLRKFQNNKRVKIHRKNSTDVTFPYNYFDWVYIDADHSYDSVIMDLSHFVKFIKPGGYLCGDDYGWSDAANGCPRGPKTAVDEFVKQFGLSLEISSNQFVIRVE
jgi:cephalosporin hydroxylase